MRLPPTLRKASTRPVADSVSGAGGDDLGQRFVRLAGVIAALRERCPWTAALTHQSLLEYLIEESYEVVEAVEAGHTGAEHAPELAGELGDVLFQVLLHARLQEEAGHFGIGDVVESLTAKMIRRNPTFLLPTARLGRIRPTIRPRSSVRGTTSRNTKSRSGRHRSTEFPPGFRPSCWPPRSRTGPGAPGCPCPRGSRTARTRSHGPARPNWGSTSLTWCAGRRPRDSTPKRRSVPRSAVSPAAPRSSGRSADRCNAPIWRCRSLLPRRFQLGWNQTAWPDS